ncbi:MAG: GNAT family N-acetyltransferase [Promethearchaeota archaeon]
MKLWEIPSTYAASSLPQNWNFRSEFAFIIYNLLTNPESCKIYTQVNPESSQMWYDNFIQIDHPYYAIRGNFPKELLLQVLPMHSEFNLAFESRMLPIINEIIPQRTITDPTGEGKENHFLCMTLCKNMLKVPSLTLDENIFTGICTTQADYRDLGWDPTLLPVPIGAGLVILGKLGESSPRSIAPAPNLVKKAGFSFAIIRGVFTKNQYRGRGYAKYVTAKLVQFLFKEYKLSAIHLWVEMRNKKAVVVYNKLGFTTTGNWLSCICNKQ